MTRIVVDANILMAALLQDGLTRRLLLHPGLELYTPTTVWDEVRRNAPELIRRSRLPGTTFEALVQVLQGRLVDVEIPLLLANLAEAERRLGTKLELDAPYVAACLAVDASLWTHDKLLTKRAGVPILLTADILDTLEM